MDARMLANPNTIISAVVLIFIGISFMIGMYWLYRAKREEAVSAHDNYLKLDSKLTMMYKHIEDLRDRGYEYDSNINTLQTDLLYFERKLNHQGDSIVEAAIEYKK